MLTLHTMFKLIRNRQFDKVHWILGLVLNIRFLLSTSSMIPGSLSEYTLLDDISANETLSNDVFVGSVNCR